MRGVHELPGNFNFAFIVDPISLDSAAEGKIWTQVAAVGDWHNPKHGNVPITREHLQRMYANFKSGKHPLPPVQLPIDYDHLSTKKDRKPGDGEAAGWFHDLAIRAGGLELWGLVEWLEDAAAKIRAKKYRYFSPTFHPNWTTLSGSEEVGPTLIGGALTNYPTLPGCVVTCSMDPAFDAIASRTVHKEDPPIYKGKIMKLKDAQGNEVDIPSASFGAIALDALVADIPAVKELQDKANAKQAPPDPAPVAALQTQLTTLSSEVNSLKGENERLAKEAKDARDKALDQELTSLSAAGWLAPAERDVMKELAQSNRALFDKTIAVRKTGKPVVALEAVHGSGESAAHASAIVQFDALVETERKNDPKLDYAAAIKKVAAAQPDLARLRNMEISVPIGRGGISMGVVQ
jgi:phage I-like protein